ncbi:MAG: hypothetical protein GY861_00230 [bacterium]|nr:hypothetical protein [bacterium]
MRSGDRRYRPERDHISKPQRPDPEENTDASSDPTDKERYQKRGARAESEREQDDPGVDRRMSEENTR